MSPEFDQHPQQVYYVLVAGDQRIAMSHDGTPVRVGRNVDNDIVFADTETSRRHAEFRCRNGLLEVRDMRSMNGTLLEGRRIVPEFWWKVNPNQILQVGINELYFERLPGATAGTPAFVQEDWLEEADTESVVHTKFDAAAAQDYDMVLEPPPRLSPPPPPPSNAWLEEPARVSEPEPEPEPQPWQDEEGWDPETEDPGAPPIEDLAPLGTPTDEWEEIPVPETEFIPVPETEFVYESAEEVPGEPESEPELESSEEMPPVPEAQEESDDIELEAPVRSQPVVAPEDIRFKPTMILPDGRLARVDPLEAGRVVVSIAEPLLGSSGETDLVRLGVDAQGRPVMGVRKEYGAEEFADYLEQQGLAAPRERTPADKPLPPGLELGGEGR